MCNTALAESNRFHCRLSPSFTACNPSVRSLHPWENPKRTKLVASKLTKPTSAHPCPAPTAWLAAACTVCPPSHTGWLFHVVADEMLPVIHNFAFDAGLHVHDHFCVI